MEITCKDRGSVSVMTLSGPRLDASLAAEFRDAARDEMASGHDIWLLDLERVTFVDSSGVGALVGLLKFMGRERRLELCGMAPAVAQVFKLTRLDTVFKIHQTLAVGLAAHGAPRLTGAD